MHSTDEMNTRLILPSEAPTELLLLADPSKRQINTYLDHSKCYQAEVNGETVGICLVRDLSSMAAEVMNIAVYPHHQGKGIGTQLLRHVIRESKTRGVKQLWVGTGTFGYQLTFYQRLGFRVDSVQRDYFTHHYREPIFERGIQLQDRLVLVRKLSGNQ